MCKLIFLYQNQSCGIIALTYDFKIILKKNVEGKCITFHNQNVKLFRVFLVQIKDEQNLKLYLIVQPHITIIITQLIGMI